MSDIYSRIEADHKNHRELLDAIADTQGDFTERRRLWNRFYYDVKAHAAAEEESFYSRLMDDPESQPEARHSVSEHQEMDDLMDELNDMDMTSSGWLNKFSTLKHDYEHHMDEEENEIFAKAREVFSSADAAGFGDRFARRKKAEFRLVDEKTEEKLED